MGLITGLSKIVMVLVGELMVTFTCPEIAKTIVGLLIIQAIPYRNNEVLECI